ncbi:MAG TPA: endolytic transglycosylase MltG, partial [Polyangium sp.]|nr:endolytic transglycosylase MltG [Polyangium sp.]
MLALGGCGAAVLSMLLAIVLGFGCWDGPARGSVAVVDWPAGLDSAQAAGILSGLGLVRSEGALAMFLRLTGGTGAFVAGPLLLPDAHDSLDLVRVFERSSRRPMVR